LLRGLDPHCSYISRKERKNFEEDFSGEFFGIGISYDIIDGILTIISPIKNSPAEKAGIRPGDQIIKIDDEVIIGESKENIIDMLTGPSGSKVFITILRKEEEILYNIERSKIEVTSIPYSYFLNDSTGYIRISTFTEKTGEELGECLNQLFNREMKQLVLDLRSNTGGILSQAIETADYFLNPDQEIVTTKGRTLDNIKRYRGNSEKTIPLIPVIILIDHGSASASEIVAGALQDWDRALIAGLRSFGKGLVQQEFPIGYGASILLTIEKYYTPSGRLIQRDYSQGYYDYYMESLEDSIYNKEVSDSFYTKGKRKVFGGGGITPDYKINWYDYNEEIEKIIYHPDRLFFQFVNQFCNNLKKNLNEIEINQLIEKKEIMNEYSQFLKNHGIVIEKSILESNKEEVLARIKKELILHFYDENKADSAYHHDNKHMLKTLLLFPEAKKLIGKYQEY